MDFGSDLQFHDNDVEFDVDIMQDASRGPSVEPAQDAMIEDVQESAIEDVDIDELAKGTADDEMVDEDFMEDAKDDHEDQGLGEEQQSATMYDDDDLIYADEDEEAHVDVDFRDEDGSGGIQENNETEVDLLDEEQHEQPLEQQILAEDTNIATRETDKDAETTVQQESTAPDTGNEQVENQSAFDEVSRADVVPEGASLERSSEAADATTEINPHAEQQSVVPPTDAESTNLGKGAIGDLTETASEAKKGVESVDGYEDEQESDSSFDVQALHPVKVQYDGTELCLFPPLEGDDTFFVQDSTLAFSPCDQLLTACRDVLGESIVQGLELVLDFPTLGLHLPEVCPHSDSFHNIALTVSQDSIYAKQLSLSQIMDVYLALRQNDHEDSIPPLQCTLRTRISLASQMTFLLSAAADGKGHAHIQSQAQRRLPADQSDPTIPRTANTAPEVGSEENSEPVPAAASVEDTQKQVTQEQTTQDVASEESSAAPVGNAEQVKEKPSNDGTVEPISYPDGGNLGRSEGISDISSAICFKPRHCFCETCFASILTDQDTNEVPDTVNHETTTEATTANEELSAEHVPRTNVPNTTVSHDAESDSDQTVRGDPSQGTAEADVSEGRHGVEVNDFALVQNDDTQPNGSEEDFAEAGTSSSGTIENIGAGDTDADASSAVIDDGVDFEDEDNYDDSNHHEADDQEQEPEQPDDTELSQSQSTTGAVQLSTNENLSNGNDIVGSAAPEASAIEDEFGDDNLDLPSDDDLLNLDDDTSSTGPSSKRKALDEDEFDFLDPATPEKKKSRPS